VEGVSDRGPKEPLAKWSGRWRVQVFQEKRALLLGRELQDYQSKSWNHHSGRGLRKRLVRPVGWVKGPEVLPRHGTL